MKRRRRCWLAGLAVLALALPVLAWLPRLAGVPAPVAMPLPRPLRPPTEADLRARFMAEHPDEQPLNHAIAEAVVQLHRERPMGTFRLGVEAGVAGNDCSDFTAAAIDDGLGAQARFRRDSPEHLYGERWSLFERRVWSPGVVVLPGDELSVRHSPWYEPYPEACWHCGLVGSDGQVYDFTKLKRWSSPRYGRHSFEQFIRHSRRPGEVVISRLRPEYRYLAKPLPAVE